LTPVEQAPRTGRVPTDLAALLVEEGAVSAEAMEHAVARQQEVGGALDTALLELGVADEVTLVGAMSRAADLPPAPVAAWDGADARARRVFPSRVAERHGLAPFALDGRELSLVATYPVDLGLLDEISFMLSLHLSAHVGPEWRVRGLIQRLYGGPLEPRLAALAGLAPAAADTAEPASRPEAAAGAPPDDAVAPVPPAAPARVEDVAFDEPGPQPGRGGEAGRTGFGGFARDLSEPLEPLAAALAQALESEDFPLDIAEEPEALAGTPGPTPSAAEEGAADVPGPADAESPATPDAAASLGSEPVREPASSESAPAAFAAAEVERDDEPETEPLREPEPDAAEPDRTSPPRWSPEEARSALAAARSRDEVVLAALRYARDFFQFAAMFAVTRDAVVGHDALGPDGDDARELCRGTAIYTTDPGTFRMVIDTRAPYLGPVTRDASGNAAILDGLARATPRTALVYPVLLRNRAACVLYADNGDAPVSARRLGDLLLLLSALGAAFERVIHARKNRRPATRAASRPLAPRRAEVEDAAAPLASPSSAAADAEWTAVPGATSPEAEPPPPALPAPTPGSDPWHATPPAGAILADEVEIDLDADEPRPPIAPAAAGPLDPAQVVTALLATAPDTTERAAAVVRVGWVGEAAVPVLCARLPGPLESEDDDASPAALGPIPAALGALGAAAVPSLLALLQDPDAARRRVAVILLGAGGDPTAFGPIADRVLDADPRVVAAAVAALGRHRRDPRMRQVPEKLRRALLSGVAARVTGAARALGALRDVEAIPLLVQVLESSDRVPAEAAAGALAQITLQRLGTDARRWLAWWKQNRGRGRAEWLFSGLTSVDRQVRVAAAEELARAAPPPVDYSADAPPEAREGAARAWAGWWSRSGRVL
jgi:HEAT repeat protein